MVHASSTTKVAWKEADELVPAVVVWHTDRASKAGRKANFNGFILIASG